MSSHQKPGCKEFSHQIRETSVNEKITSETQNLALAADDIEPTARPSQHVYLTGLKGILVIESFIWIFFETFIPTLTSSSTEGPWYQEILRAIFSVPFWNASFIYNFFIILSMRAICISFLENPTGQTYAATVVRRILRMVILLFFGSGMATLIFSQMGTEFIDEFKLKLPNQTIHTPTIVYDTVAAFNSLFNLFWLNGGFYQQAANTFWPSHTLWVPSVMYYQSFTVYFLMVILPYTRPKWHIQGLGLFALGSFWMGSWGWYAATGLMIADVTINSTLRAKFKQGYKVKDDFHIPYWLLAIAFTAIGLGLKYTFVVLPQFNDSLLVLHPYLDLSEMYSTTSYADSGPYPRVDDWFLIVGVMLAVELLASVQRNLSYQPLVWLGKRSFSIFVAQCILFWTGGIELWLILQDRGISTAGVNAVVFVVCLSGVVVFSELYYRLIDLPSSWIAKNVYLWLVD